MTWICPLCRGCQFLNWQFLEGLCPDLTPISGMLLHALTLSGTWELKQLEPFKGMPLTSFACDNTQVADLSPLRGMQLKTLVCHVTRVADLSPLKGMPLEILFCDRTLITDRATGRHEAEEVDVHAESRAEGTGSHSTDDLSGGNWDGRRQVFSQQRILEKIRCRSIYVTLKKCAY